MITDVHCKLFYIIHISQLLIFTMHITITSQAYMKYHIAEKFGGNNVWQIYTYKLIAEKSLGND